MSSELVKYLHEILDGKASVSTINARVRYLNNLARSTKNSKDISFLNDTKAIMDIIQGSSNINSQWTGLMHINAAIKADPSKISKEAAKFYSDYISSIRTERNQQNANNARTEKQKDRYIPLPELQETIHEAFNALLIQHNMGLSIDIRKIRVAAQDRDFVKAYHQLLTVAVYALQPPLRSDWFALKIVKRLGDIKDSDSNFIYIKNQSRMKLILNEYKTAYLTGTRSIEIEDPDLRRYIYGWYKILTVLVEEPAYLLGYTITKTAIVYNENTETTRRTIPIISQKVFGKPLTINDFRHIYEINLQTDPRYAKMTQAERNTEHAKLLHSTPTAQLYNVH